ALAIQRDAEGGFGQALEDRRTARLIGPDVQARLVELFDEDVGRPLAGVNVMIEADDTQIDGLAKGPGDVDVRTRGVHRDGPACGVVVGAVKGRAELAEPDDLTVWILLHQEAIPLIEHLPDEGFLPEEARGAGKVARGVNVSRSVHRDAITPAVQAGYLL